VSQPPSILPLRFRNVSLRAGDDLLIDALSLDIDAGPRTVIMGPNGAGKSLFLRLAHGLIRPTQGEVSWRGRDGLGPTRGQAMVFSRPVMLRRSARANIELALALSGRPTSEATDRTDTALALTGLEALAGRQATSLSTGEQQRLALARAWALSPQVLLLDEPTSNLDPAAAHAVENLIRQFSESGMKVIMTTHDLIQARRLGEDILLLHHGRLVERAAADAFFSAPQSDVARAFVTGTLTW